MLYSILVMSLHADTYIGISSFKYISIEFLRGALLLTCSRPCGPMMLHLALRHRTFRNRRIASRIRISDIPNTDGASWEIKRLLGALLGVVT